MSSTPITDAARCHISFEAGCGILIWPNKEGGYVPYETAERLEKELSEARQTIEDVCLGITINCVVCGKSKPCNCDKGANAR